MQLFPPSFFFLLGIKTDLNLLFSSNLYVCHFLTTKDHVSLQYAIVPSCLGLHWIHEGAKLCSTVNHLSALCDGKNSLLSKEEYSSLKRGTKYFHLH
jgi:hypothetical protein